MGQQKCTKAEPLLLAGYVGLKQTEAQATTRPTSSRPSRLPDALQRLIDLYTAWDKPDQATKWQKALSEHQAATSPQPAANSAANSNDNP